MKIPAVGRRGVAVSPPLTEYEVCPPVVRLPCRWGGQGEVSTSLNLSCVIPWPVLVTSCSETRNGLLAGAIRQACFLSPSVFVFPQFRSFLIIHTSINP